MTRCSLFAVRCSLFAVRCSLLAALLLTVVADDASSQIPQGTWLTGVSHPGVAPWPGTFEAIHMAVIPNGQGSEKVIAWDKNESNQNITNGPPGAAIPFSGNWLQRFAVGDPETNVWTNYVLSVPPHPSTQEHLGDFFCAGHVWLPDGRLFMAGGNRVYGNTGALPAGSPATLPGGQAPAVPLSAAGGEYHGSRVAAIWNPAALPRTAANNFGWTFLPLMAVPRWYPTVTLLGNSTVLVAGGSTKNPQSGSCASLDAGYNSYEVYDLQTAGWETIQTPTGPVQALYDGPTGAPCYSMLGEYPRMHLMSNNRLFMSGMFAGSNRLWHDLLVPSVAGAPAVEFWDSSPPAPATPTPGWPVPSVFRDYGASVLLPNIGGPGRSDMVMALGGRVGGIATTATRVIQVGSSPSWVNGARLNFVRHCLNAVLLPNGEILAVGGAVDGFATTLSPSRTSEIYRSGSWVVDDMQASARAYHSTAVLLPSGVVISAGGDQRSSDYETYVPGYLSPPAGVSRPMFAGLWATAGPSVLGWDTDYMIEYDPLGDERVQRVVLMRPCSTTHHSDMDQHYIELQNVVPPTSGGGGGAPIGTVQLDSIWVRTPRPPVTGANPSRVSALRGWYMMFLVSARGFVSNAKWVNLP